MVLLIMRACIGDLLYDALLWININQLYSYMYLKYSLAGCVSGRVVGCISIILICFGDDWAFDFKWLWYPEIQYPKVIVTVLHLCVDQLRILKVS